MEINENTFYITDQEKQDFINNNELVANSFWINFLGISALYNKDKDHILLKQYLRDKVQINSITDKSNDLPLIIKILDDKGLLKQVNEYTRYLALLKKGKIQKIDEDLLRTMLKRIILTKVKPSERIKSHVKDFLDGSSPLSNIDTALYNFAKKNKICDEYRMIYKRIKGDTTDDVVDDKLKQPDTPKQSIEDEISFFNDLYQQHKTNIPWIPDNKRAQKLFLNSLFYFFSDKIITILNKNNIKGIDVMSNISVDDLNDMIQNDFCKNDPVLSKTYYGTSTLNSIISLLSDMFESRLDIVYILQIIDELPYQTLMKMFLSKFLSNFETWGTYNPNKYIELIKKVVIDKTTEENFVKNFRKHPLNDMSTSHLKLFSKKEIAEKLIPLFVKNNLNILPRASAVDSLKSKNEVKIFLDSGYLKKYYEQVSTTQKEKIKTVLLSIGETPDWIEITDDDKDEMYTNFINYLDVGSRSNFFSNIDTDYYDFLQNNGILKRVLDHWENPKYDDFLERNQFTIKKLTQFTKLIKARKREFYIQDYERWFFDRLYAFWLQSMKGNPQETELLEFYVNLFIDSGIQPKALQNIAPTSFIQTLTNSPGISEDLLIKLFSNNFNRLDEYYLRDIIKSLFHGSTRLETTKKIMKNLNVVKKIGIGITSLIYSGIAGKNYFILTLEDLKKYVPVNMIPTLYEYIFKDDVEPKSEVIMIRQYIKNNFFLKDVVLVNAPILNTKSYIEIVKEYKNYLKNQGDWLIKVRNSANPEILKLIIDDKEYAKQLLNKHKFFNTIEDPENIISALKSSYPLEGQIPYILDQYNYREIIFKLLKSASNEQFDEALKKMFPNKTMQAINNNIKNAIIQQGLVQQIFDDESAVIKPLQRLDSKGLKQILKFNNITTTDVKIRKKKNEPQLAYYNRMMQSPELKEIIEKLKVEKIEETEEELELKTIDYAKYNNGRHGNTALEFLESFNVNMETDEFKVFVQQNPEPVIIPAFHGTGSVGASMILRYGFRILPQTAGMTTGRMLGHGIYFSNVIEKSAQYVGDAGFSRRHGTIGYMLEMEAYIGKKKENYDEAGTGGDSIRSPEWVVFDPRAQLKIVKAHKVKIVPKNYIKDLKGKHQMNETKKRKFFGYLNEEKTKGKNVIHYMFYDGTLIDHNGKIISLENFEKQYNNKNIVVDSGQKGPVVILHTDAKVNGSVHIPFTQEFVEDDPDGLFSQYKTIIKGILNK